MSNKILQFEPFKNAKKWDDEYAKFLGYTEKYFGAKTDPEQMAKRLYFAMRYLSGVANSFWVLSKLGINQDNKELQKSIQKSKLYCIDWLEEILNKLKN